MKPENQLFLPARASKSKFLSVNVLIAIVIYVLSASRSYGIVILEGESGILHYTYVSLAQPSWPQYMTTIGNLSWDYVSGDGGDAIASITIANDNLTGRFVDLNTKDATFDLLINTIDDGNPYNDGCGNWVVKVSVAGWDPWVDNNFRVDFPDAYVTVIDPVPEPSTVMLLGIGGLGMAGMAYRKRKSMAFSFALQFLVAKFWVFA